MIGLDAAGKTTVLYRLKLSEKVVTIPTIGFNVETVEYRNLKLVIWDIGGQDRIRPLWKHYYSGVNAIIFVVDSNDRARIEEAADELHKILLEEELKDAAILVLANKQDLPNKMEVAEVTQKLGMFNVKGRKWNVQGCVATTGDGIYEGLEWLSKNVPDA